MSTLNDKGLNHLLVLHQGSDRVYNVLSDLEVLWCWLCRADDLFKSHMTGRIDDL